MYASLRRKDDNPQRGNALKLSTAHVKEKRKRKKGERERKKPEQRKGGRSTQLLELQLDRKLLTLLANPHFEQPVSGMPGAETVPNWINTGQVELQPTSPLSSGCLGEAEWETDLVVFCALAFYTRLLIKSPTGQRDMVAIKSGPQAYHENYQTAQLAPDVCHVGEKLIFPTADKGTKRI